MDRSDEFVAARALQYYAEHMAKSARLAKSGGHAATARFLRQEADEAAAARKRILESLGLKSELCPPAGRMARERRPQ